MSITDHESDSPVVLYVEDDDLTRERVAARLRQQGINLIAAGSGEQALELCSEVAAVDVALLDLELPGISGQETWQRLLRRFPDVVGVVCSGALDDETRLDLKKQGLRSDCCLCKPCRFHELLAALKRAGNAGSSSS